MGQKTGDGCRLIDEGTLARSYRSPEGSDGRSLFLNFTVIRTTLRSGDSAHFTSQLAHASSNTSDKTVTVLYVGTPAIFSEELRSA